MLETSSKQKSGGLIIAGFHRSGTSMIGQMLESHGVSLGSNLIAGNEFNRFGYFEDVPVVHFHDAVLRRVGADWSKPLSAPIVFTEDERRWVLSYVAERERAGEDWALKDPRMCRFVRQWKELVPEIKFLIVYRSPAESGNSVNRRANMDIARSGDTDDVARQFYLDPDLALRLWVEHNRELVELRAAHPDDCMVVGHHHVLAGYDLVAALDARFGLATNTPQVANTIDLSALSSRMSSIYYMDAVLIDSAVQLWHELQSRDIAVAQGWPSMDISASMVADPGGLKARAAMIAVQVKELYKRIGEHNSELAEQHSAIAKQQSTIAEQHSAIAKQGSTIAEQHSAIAKQQSTIAEQHAAIAKQQSTIAEQQSEIAKLTASVEGIRPLARKASKPPFSLFFMQHPKYRRAIEDFLSKWPDGWPPLSASTTTRCQRRGIY